MAVYGALVWGPHFGLHITRFLVGYGVLAVLCLAAWRALGSRPSRGAWLWVWAGALVFRALCLTEAPQLSDDIYRYIWDGRLSVQGVNPFLHAPEAAETAPYRTELWGFINNPHLPTIYPPLLQGVFAATAWAAPTVLGFKVVFTLFDLASGLFLWLLLRRAQRGHWAVLYLWHPAVVTEFAGQGHADAVGVFLVSLALWLWVTRRELASGMALAGAVLVKFFAVLAWPALVRPLGRRWLWLPAVVAVAYLPFVWSGANPLGSLGAFAARWQANAFLFTLWEDWPGWWPRAVSAAPALALAAWGWGRGWEWPRVYSWALGLLLLCSPVIHPWYVLWLLPAALWLKHPAWVVWAFLAPLTYWVLPAYLATGVWAEPIWVKAAVYGAVTLTLAWGWITTRRSETRPG